MPLNLAINKTQKEYVHPDKRRISGIGLDVIAG